MTENKSLIALSEKLLPNFDQAELICCRLQRQWYLRYFFLSFVYRLYNYKIAFCMLILAPIVSEKIVLLNVTKQGLL